MSYSNVVYKVLKRYAIRIDNIIKACKVPGRQLTYSQKLGQFVSQIIGKSLSDRKDKESFLQYVIQQSVKRDVNFIAYISTDTFYTGNAMFLFRPHPRGPGAIVYSLAMSCPKGPNILNIAKFFPNDSTVSVYISSGYKAICYDACVSGSQYVVKSPGTTNIASYGMGNKVSSIVIMKDQITSAQYNSLRSTANMYRSQRDYANRRLNKVKKQLRDATQSVQDMNQEVKEEQQSHNITKSQLGEAQAKNTKIEEQNALLQEQSNEANLKTNIAASQKSMETFTSIRETIDTNTFGTTMALSALIVALSLSIIQLAKN